MERTEIYRDGRHVTVPEIWVGGTPTLPTLRLLSGQSILP